MKKETIKERGFWHESNFWLGYAFWNAMMAPTFLIISIILAEENKIPDYLVVCIGLLSVMKCYLFAVALNMYLKLRDELK